MSPPLGLKSSCPGQRAAETWGCYDCYFARLPSSRRGPPSRRFWEAVRSGRPRQVGVDELFDRGADDACRVIAAVGLSEDQGALDQRREAVGERLRRRRVG